MSVVTEYEAIKAKAWDAIDVGLLEAGEQGKDVLKSVIYDNVYSYWASPFAMYKRRYDDGGLGDTRNMIVSVIDIGSANKSHELQIENFAGLQDYGTNFRTQYTGPVGENGPQMNLQDRSKAAQARWSKHLAVPNGYAGDRLDRIVETGDGSYRQPGPRPFYKDAEKQMVDGGLVDGCIASALMDAGFEVTVV